MSGLHRAFGLGLAAALSLSAATFSVPSLAQKSAQADKTKKKKPPAKKAPKKKAPAKSDAAPARASDAAVVAALDLPLAIQKATLENGLRVVMNVDRTSPTLAVAITYDVGSRREEKGKSGLAALFEHLMFQGSDNVAKGEHEALLAARSGTSDAMTSVDRTTFVSVVPEAELGLALWLEADRMRSLRLTAENLEAQKRALAGEQQARAAASSYSAGAVRLEELVFQGYFPYEHGRAGDEADRDAIDLKAAAAFRAMYAPNNAVLTIAGDFDADEAMTLVRQWFETIPRGAVSAFDAPPFPEQTSQRTAVLHDERLEAPELRYGWAVPPSGSPDHEALEIAAILLGDGEGSVLYQRLVREKKVATSVSTNVAGRRGPDLLSLRASLTANAKVLSVEKIIETELKTLSTRGPSDADLARAKRRAQAALVLGLESNASRAAALGDYETFFGDARAVTTRPAKLIAVTKDDVRRVIADHLGPTRRTIIETYPPEPPKAERAPHHASAAEPAVEKPAAKKTSGDKKTPAKKTGSDKKASGDKKAPAKKASGDKKTPPRKKTKKP